MNPVQPILRHATFDLVSIGDNIAKWNHVYIVESKNELARCIKLRDTDNGEEDYMIAREFNGLEYQLI